MKQKCRYRTDFISSVQKEDHRCLWTSFGTKRVRLERVKNHLHVNLIPAVRHFSVTSKDLFYSRPFNRSLLVNVCSLKDLDQYINKSFVHSKFVCMFF